jgi:hypothetical protein
VNIPEQEPQVGQAASSMRAMSSSDTSSATASAIAVIRFRPLRTVPSTSTVLPPSIGPPETNTVGMFSRKAAFSIPGVILSQLEMQTSASAQCALTMYSTLSAITRGQRVEHAAMAHGDSVIDRDRVELARNPAGLLDRLGDDLPDRLKVCVTGNELGVGVRDRDDRLLADVLARNPRSTQQRACSGHVATVGDCAGPELWHTFRLPTPSGRAKTQRWRLSQSSASSAQRSWSRQRPLIFR